MEGPVTIILLSAIVGAVAGWRGRSRLGLVCAGIVPALGVGAFIVYAEYRLSEFGITHYEKGGTTVLRGQLVIAALAAAVGVGAYLTVAKARTP